MKTGEAVGKVPELAIAVCGADGSQDVVGVERRDASEIIKNIVGEAPVFAVESCANEVGELPVRVSRGMRAVR